MLPLLKNTLCYTLFLFLFGCISVTLPPKNIGEGALAPETNACKADRLQPFRKPLLPLLASSQNDLRLLPPGREEKRPGQSIPSSGLRPHLGRERNHFAYTFQKLTYPSIESGKEVRAYFYRPSGRGPFPVVVILPITEGDFFTEHFARFLAEQRFAVLRYESRGEFSVIIPRSQTGRGALQRFKDYFHAYAVDILRGIDWLESQPEIDRARIGLFGISQGAVVGSLVAGLDPRIRSGVFILGGGGLAGILSSTEEKGLAQLRERILLSGEFPENSFHHEADAAFSLIDPLTYAHCVKPSTMLLVDARFDRVILPTYADLLWNKMGKPPRLQLPAGHYTAGLFLPYIRSATLRHFQSTLE